MRARTAEADRTTACSQVRRSRHGGTIIAAIAPAIQLWVVAQVAGLLALPWAAFLFARLPGRGLILALPLGLLVVAYPAWLLPSIGAVPSGAAAIAIAVAVLALPAVVVAARAFRRRPPVGRDLRALARRPDVRLWTIGQVVFTATFAAFAVLRAFSPDLWIGEQPADLAILASLDRADELPPLDPWLAGEELNYYYLGHFAIAVPARLAGLAPETALMAGGALLPALCAVAVYAVAASLALGFPRVGLRRAVGAGLAAVALAIVLGNVAGGLQLLATPSAPADYDWWAPSRLLPDTVTEFPFFAFLFGELHAHMLAVPFALLVVAWAVQVGLAGPRRWGRGRAALAVAAELALVALMAGFLYAANTWDFPTALAVVAVALSLWAATRAGSDGLRGAAAGAGARWIAIGAGSIVLWLPFHAAFDAGDRSPLLVPEATGLGDFLAGYGGMLGLALVLLVPLGVHLVRGTGASRRALVAGGVAGGLIVAAGIALGEIARVVPAMVVGLLAVAAWRGGRSAAERLLLAFVAVAVALVFAGEFAYVPDGFLGTENFRFNTIFKFAYQAWFVLAIAAGCVVVLAGRWLDGRGGLAWRVGAGIMLALAAVYPVVGTWARTGGFEAEPTLDGMRWLDRAAPGDAAAIRWLRAHASGAPTVLEAAGPDYSRDRHARIATFTGLPTVIGWAGHEIQLNHDPGTRTADVTRLYATTDLAAARREIARHAIRYVVVGPLERRSYPRAGLAKFGRLGRAVLVSAGTTVYDVEP